MFSYRFLKKVTVEELEEALREPKNKLKK